MKKKMSEIKEIESKLISYKESYYLGNPLVSDEEYDALENHLKEISPESFVLNLVGTAPSSNLPKVKHDKKMLSLEKTYEYTELIDWVKNETVVSTIKLDGISCSLIYKEGALVMAKTRGNGVLGEDISNKASWISTIPKKISLNGRVEVRGEILCVFDEFEKLKIKMKNLGLEEPTSPRNISAGLISRKDNLCLCNHLSFKAFDLILYGEDHLSEETQKIAALEKENFILAEYEVHKSKDTIQKTLDRASALMNDGDYQLDGIVFTYNRLDLHHKLGETAHHPRYKIAYKFRGESKVAKVKNIFWDISRNGVYTPVAIIEPIELSGAMISRVTLHNYGVVRDHNLKAGDEIKVTRSGEVIPKFLGVKKAAPGEISVPESCKYCDKALEVIEIRIICSNENCNGKLKGQILNFIQKIGIDDLSEKRLDQLIQSQLVTRIEDLYSLSIEKLLQLDKVQEKLASKLIQSIKESKNVDLITFMSSLGLTGGALNKNEKIFKAGFNTIEKYLCLTLDQMISIEGFAEKSAQDYLKSLSKKKELINNLMSLGFDFSTTDQTDTSGSVLNGKKICITGSLSRKRSEIEKEIKLHGGEVVKTVSTKTDYLVCNDKSSTSSKMLKAQGLGVSVITEEELYSLF
tara:strand:- start:2421 stop:4325 length:1905 start_codon:yes stop_codon:yes gene_type:complete